jgi:hypothetical protein
MQATIQYYLDEAGQKASLIAGGDGKREQSTTVEINAEQVALFGIYNSRLAATCEYGAERTSCGTWGSHRFSTVPTAAELLSFLNERETTRAAVLAEEAKTKAEKEARYKADAAAKRVAAIAKLQAALVAREVIQPPFEGYKYLQIDGVALNPSDEDCGPAATEMLALAAAERERKAARETRLKAIKVGTATLRPCKALPDNQYEFDVPVSRLDNDWAKHVQAVEASKPEGYAFLGDWLKPGNTAILQVGELLLVGGKRWEGSRKHGDWAYEKKLYIVTPAGVRLICKNGDAKAKAIEYLALGRDERIAKIVSTVLKNCADNIAKLEAFDRNEYAEEVEQLDAALKSWRDLRAACQEAATANNSTTEVWKPIPGWPQPESGTATYLLLSSCPRTLCP